MNHEFCSSIDLGDLGEVEVEVSYEADGYKPLGIDSVFIPMFDKEVAGWLKDSVLDDLYRQACQHLVEYRTGGEP